MNKIPFSMDELQIARKEKVGRRGEVEVRNYPVSRKEAYIAAIRDKKPIWFLTGGEASDFTPSVIPDNIARAFCFEAEPYEKKGGKDMFGIEWEFVPMAGGSMVKPGNPLLEDVNDWKEKIVFPDIESWDWEGSKKLNASFFDNDRFHRITFLNGCWFERLISFMDFEGAAMAMIDEDQEDALKELMHETTSLYLRIIDKCFEVFPALDGICIHDDWGSQMAPFFSEAAARNIILPEMKRLVEHVHGMDKLCELHSCGHIEDRCNLFVEAGFDAWAPMPMNDTAALFDKYGDKIVIAQSGIESPYDPETATEEEQRAYARAFFARYAVPGKAATLGHRAQFVTPIFAEELYKESRIRYYEL